MRIGLYFIPESGPLYEAGSKLLGYDIRAQQQIEVPAFIKPEWVATAGSYGFHVTVSDAIDIDDSKLLEVIGQTERILSCLHPDNSYELTKERVGFWREDSDQATILLRPSRRVELLHDLLTASINPLGNGSEYTERLAQQGADYFTESPTQVRKTEQFYSPYIFDDFRPHFTCVNPFTGSVTERIVVENALAEYFPAFDLVEFHSLALVAKTSSETHFRIIKEFELNVA